MIKDYLTPKHIIYAGVSLFTFAVVLLEINYSQSFLGIVMTIILGLFLTQWYLFVGLIKSREKESLNFFTQRVDGTLLPKWQIFSLSGIVTLYIIALGYLSDPEFNFSGTVVIFLYIMGPVAFMLIKKWYSFGLAALWVWFPIEWSVISDAIHINLGLPFSRVLN